MVCLRLALTITHPAHAFLEFSLRGLGDTRVTVVPQPSNNTSCLVDMHKYTYLGSYVEEELTLETGKRNTPPPREITRFDDLGADLSVADYLHAYLWRPVEERWLIGTRRNRAAE